MTIKFLKMAEKFWETKTRAECCETGRMVITQPREGLVA